jgi:hypothetical protein
VFYQRVHCVSDRGIKVNSRENRKGETAREFSIMTWKAPSFVWRLPLYFMQVVLFLPLAVNSSLAKHQSWSE